MGTEGWIGGLGQKGGDGVVATGIWVKVDRRVGIELWG